MNRRAEREANELVKGCAVVIGAIFALCLVVRLLGVVWLFWWASGTNDGAAS